MDDLKEKIVRARNLQITIENYKKELEDVNEKLTKATDSLDLLKSDILNGMKLNKLEEVDIPECDVKAGLFKKVTKNFEEDKILSLLKEKGLLNLIKVKESVSKKDLNKELKSNNSLKEELLPYTSDKVTEYVVICTWDNYALMLEHINDNKGLKG